MDGQPYNQFGQIIASGGLDAVATQQSHGWTEAQSIAWLHDRYGVLEAGTQEQVLSLAGQAIAGGLALAAALAILGLPIATAVVAGVQGGLAADDILAAALQAGGTSEQVGQIMKVLGEPLGLGEIPQVPELFGETPDGRRGTIAIDVPALSGGRPIQVDLDIGEVHTFLDVLNEISDQLDELAGQYPEKFKWWSDNSDSALNPVIKWAIRRF